MPADIGLRVNDKHVVYETFDDEVLAVNIDTGTYYSLAGSASQIWHCVLAGTTIEAITAKLAGLYLGEPTMIRAACVEFLDQMQREGLIMDDPSATAAATEPSVPQAGERQPFTAPSMAVFTDMQDLLLLDPIHDVDAVGGWPIAKSETDRPNHK